MEKLRDHRLRHHFAERYDFRANAIDWDYQFAIREKVRSSLLEIVGTPLPH